MRLLVALLACLLLAAPAQARLRGPSVPPPPGCDAVSIKRALSADGDVCIHRVLVTEVTNGAEQNDTTFTVTDHRHSLAVRVANWWPQGAPDAGAVVTLWGKMTAGRLVVDRWLDLAHGDGPGAYPEADQVAVDDGSVPNDRSVWVPAITFALDPQDNGDGDIHVQTFSPCRTAGLTFETTPPLRGYVWHPAVPGLTSSTDRGDQPSSHLADAPPIGVPVLMLGSTRTDYGFGWQEVHPVRAWRPLSAAELAGLAARCAADPLPHLDSGPSYGGHAVPIPFGAPPCTDGSEFGSPPGFGACDGPHCWVVHEVIGQPEELAGPCLGVAPMTHASQEGLPEQLPAAAPGILPAPAREEPSDERETEHVTHVEAPLVAAYGPACRAAGVPGAAVAGCATGLAHLASGERLTPAQACRYAPGAACRTAARRLTRRLTAAR